MIHDGLRFFFSSRSSPNSVLLFARRSSGRSEGHHVAPAEIVLTSSSCFGFDIKDCEILRTSRTTCDPGQDSKSRACESDVDIVMIQGIVVPRV